MSIEFIVDKGKCIGCGLCVKDCSPKILALDENKKPQVVEERENNCMKCQHCLCVCPVGAISILGKNPENSSECQNSFNSEEILQLIKERRSVRFYQKKNVEQMEQLKEMLNYVPTGVNNHNLQFIFVEDINVMDRLRDKVSKVLIELTSKSKFVQKQFGRYIKPIQNGEDIIFRGAPHMLVVLTPKNAPCKDVDPIIALSYFELYAKSLGISTCWCGLAYYCFKFIPQLRGLLNIPKTHDVGYCMLFGYPDIQYKRTIQPVEYKKSVLSEIKDKELSFFEKIFNN